jgi:hypothetical protein
MNNKYLLAISLLMSCAVSVVNAKEISINQNVGYYDEKVIQTNIRTECANLGDQLAASTATAVQKSGWSVTKQSELDTGAPGVNLKLTITNAHSGGNAFLGHSKSVSIQAELFKDGKLIDTFVGTRNSNGGIGGGFKGSCGVLARCVNTLGKDVNAWLQKQTI